MFFSFFFVIRTNIYNKAKNNFFYFFLIYLFFIKIFLYICTNKQKQIKFTIMTNLKTLDTHRAQQITDKLQEGEKVKEQIRNVSLCFLFFALIILAPFIESIFNLSI